MIPNNENWRRLIEAMAHGVLISDKNGVILYINELAAKLFDRPAIELIGTTFSAPEAANKIQNIEIVQLNGRTIKAKMTVKKGSWENLYAWIITLEDINKLKLDEKVLELSSTAFNSATEGIIVTDENLLLLQANTSFLEMTGYNIEDILGKNPSTFLQSGGQDKNFYHALWEQVNKEGHWSGAILNKRKNNVPIPMFLTIIAVKNNDGDISHYIGFFYDLSESKKNKDIIQYSKTHDPLTSLPNTFQLVNDLEKYINRYSNEENYLNVLIIRISDSNKKYRLLTDNVENRNRITLEVARRIDESTKQKKLLSRTGPREFTVIYLSKLTLFSMKKIADELVDKLSRPYSINGQKFNLACNIGITGHDKKIPISAENLLMQANSALHSATQQGRNKIAFYDPIIEQQTIEFSTLLDSIRQGLKNNQFKMYYQPKIDLVQGKVIGLEALIRWQHPDKGILAPEQFLLHKMDDHPISLEMGHWTLHTVLQQAESLLKKNIQIPISINISSYQLQQASFVSDLLAGLSKFPNVPRNMIMLEILETSSLNDLPYINQKIKACQSSGIKVSLDDFGTGYSSLNYLKELDIDEVKMDQIFIRDCIYRTDDLIILKATIELCNMLGLTLIAEGVETNIHAKLLLSLGCSRMQGYAIAKAMTATSINRWLKNWKPDPSLLQTRFTAIELESFIKKSFQHYHNFNAIQRYLNYKELSLIDFHYSSCKFAQWLNEHQHLFKNTRTFKRFDKVHQLIHKQALKIIEFANQGKAIQANSLFSELLKTREIFVYQLIKSILEDD